jgi:hypothetical protein
MQRGFAANFVSSLHCGNQLERGTADSNFNPRTVKAKGAAPRLTSVLRLIHCDISSSLSRRSLERLVDMEVSRERLDFGIFGERALAETRRSSEPENYSILSIKFGGLKRQEKSNTEFTESLPVQAGTEVTETETS